MLNLRRAVPKSGFGSLNNQFDAIFNCSYDAIAILAVRSDDYRFVQSNTAHKRMTGVYNVKGKTLEQVFGDAKAKFLRNYYKDCILIKKPLEFEMDFEFNSDRIALQTCLNPICDCGVVRYVVSSSKDITKTKTSQNDNDGFSINLSTVFNQHSVIMLLIDHASGRIVDANLAACAFYGYERDELLCLTIFDLNILSSDELRKQLTIAIDKQNRYFGFPHQAKDGTIHYVDVYTCPIYVDKRELLFAIIHDVSDREGYRKRLNSEKELLRTTLNSIGEGVVATDLDGRITIASKVALDMAGWKKDEALGKHFDDVFLLRDEMTNEPVENLTNKVFRMGRRTTLTCNYVIIGRRGTRTPISNSAAPIIGEDGKTLGVVMAFRDISKDKIDSDRILYISYHDYLTGLYNRRFLEEYIEKATYSDQLPISVIVGDINGLKLTNDIFGHDMGDTLLAKAAEIIKKVCPHEGVPARWGGDEFIILLPHTEEAIAETIVRKIRTTCEIELDSTMRVSLSLGYATKGSTVIDIRETIRTAEEYMYRHKLLDGKSYHNALIHTLLATLCEKSIETEQHTKRLSDLCYAFGLMINLQSNELDELSLLALLHDIGKVGIRQSILKKPGKLTDDEWGEMKQHPAIGYRIAKSTTELSGIADYILYHHERWDGSGYPQRLKGNEIPLSCRILALADAYDAMTSDRVYRKAMTQSEAIAELRKNAGTQFDPKLVEPFISTVLSIEILNSF